MRLFLSNVRWITANHVVAHNPPVYGREFDLPEEIIDRKVTKMKMISPSNRAVDVGQTLNDKEYIGMCRREVMDDFFAESE